LYLLVHYFVASGRASGLQGENTISFYNTAYKLQLLNSASLFYRHLSNELDYTGVRLFHVDSQRN